MGDLTGGQNPLGVFQSSMSNASRMLYFMTEAKVLGVHLANTQLLADLPLEISLEEATNCLLSDWFHFEDVLLTAKHRGYRTRTVYTHSGVQQLAHDRLMDYALTMPHTVDPDVTVMKVMDLFLVTLKCADEIARYELDETEEAVLMQFHMLKKLQQTYGASVELRMHTNTLLGDLMRYYDQTYYGCSGAVRLGNLVACLQSIQEMNRAVACASALHRLNMRKDGECCR
ncbi:hypothetical protein AAVH_14263 [Aphelenchoides avenae]|nr:hypothetical protein AAVH_14263 [Aphelenchus avenae]